MKRSYRLPLMIGFAILASVFITKTSFFRVDAQGRVVSQKKQPKLETTALVEAVKLAGDPVVLINELDADQTSTDSNEFVELKTAVGGSLNGYVLVFYNGSNDLSYAAYDLDGQMGDANGLVVVGSSTVPGVDLVFPGATDQLQNGADAVALYVGNAADFPTNTPVTTANLVDAVVYDTSDADDPGLLALLPAGAGQLQIDENANLNATTVSIQRCSAETLDGRAFVLNAPTSNAVNACPQPANVDMNGDGRTDFLIIRESTGGFGANMFERDVPRSMRDRMRLAAQRSETAPLGGSSPVEWWGFNNTVSGGSKGTNVIFGESDDLPVSGDFDGDDRDDVAVWRPGPPDQAAFYWINSSDLTFDYTFFGQTGDNPAIVGDYDGDGRDDPATFRCPPTGSGAGQCYFFYAASTNNPNRLITWVPFGFGEAFDFFPYPGDFDGDGRHDFCFQAVDPSNPQQGVFWLAKNDGTYDVETIRWGYSTDFLIPGDYDGDGRSDFAVMRNELGRLTFYVLERDGGMYVRQWGLASDFAVPGDYDGDGRQDLAIYRWNAVDATFWVLPTNGGPIQIFTYGLRGDVPVANWYVQ